MIYHLILNLYLLVIKIASPFNKKAKAFIDGRKINKPKIKNCIWMHCSSLGEYEQGKELLKRIKKDSPKQKILLTFYSPSGYENTKTNNLVDEIQYLPFDFYDNIKNWIEYVNPKYLILVKYDFWPNLLKVLSEKNIPVYVVSATFRKKFFQLLFIYKKLKTIKHFWVQDLDSKIHLNSIGVNQATVCGDLRFDTVFSNLKNKTEIQLIKNFKKKSKLLLFGSIYQNEINFVPKNYNYKIIIAPHEMKDVEKFKTLPNSILYSKANEKNIKNYSLIIIDNIGMLSNLYQYADIAYIGGGFKSGIHNILEAAIFNCPCIFGPNYKRFPEAIDLIKIGAAKTIKTKNEFEVSLNYFLKNKEKINSFDYCLNKKGATKKIFEILKKRESIL